MVPIVTLNLRLLRTGKTTADAFTPTFAPDAARALSRGSWADVDGAEIFVGQMYSNAPPWIEFISTGYTGGLEGFHTAGAGAIIYIPVKDRVFGVCFGHVHIALKDDAFERQFGLKVTLNTVPKDKLRTLDLATPDAVTFQKRIQASRDSNFSEFGVDQLRDLARVAGGTPKDKDFATLLQVRTTCQLAAGWKWTAFLRSANPS